jgi:PAS domain S-box-containing protein
MNPDQPSALQALLESHARFQAIFENAAVGIGLMSLDRKIMTANAAVARLVGYTPQEMTDIQLADLIHPDDRLIDAELYQQLIAGERESFAVEKRYIRKDGSAVWARLIMSAVRNADGKPAYLIGLVEDIDQARRDRQELRASEARLRALFDNTSVGVAMLTLDRRVLQLNAAAERIIGYSAEEMKDINPVELSHPDDRNLGTELVADLIAGRTDQINFERRYRRKDGRYFWGRVSYSSVRGPDGAPQYLIGLIEDIDEQKRAQEQLADQEALYTRLLEQRVAERTFELRQSNAQLQREIEQRQKVEATLSQKAAEEAVTAERNRLARDLHDAVTQTLFSASLVADVLPDLWEINEAEARRRLEELRQLTRGALAEMRTLLLELRPTALTEAALPDLLRQLAEAVTGRARLPVHLTVDGDCCLGPDVQVALYRIAQEFLTITVKSARAGEANISLRARPGQIRLSLTDNGVGFDPDKVPPNHLGLQIMRERADAVGARLSIYSEPGQGTQVTVVWVSLGSKTG